MVYCSVCGNSLQGNERTCPCCGSILNSGNTIEDTNTMMTEGDYLGRGVFLDNEQQNRYYEPDETQGYSRDSVTVAAQTYGAPSDRSRLRQSFDRQPAGGNGYNMTPEPPRPGQGYNIPEPPRPGQGYNIPEPPRPGNGYNGPDSSEMIYDTQPTTQGRTYNTRSEYTRSQRTYDEPTGSRDYDEYEPPRKNGNRNMLLWCILMVLVVVVISGGLIIYVVLKGDKNGNGNSASTEEAASTEEFQEVVVKDTFQDVNFREYVMNYVDTDGNGRLNYDEVQAVKELQIAQKGIKDLTGINVFTELTKLDCSGNGLRNIDISANENLVSVKCTGNNATTIYINGRYNIGSDNDNDDVKETFSVNGSNELKITYDTGVKIVNGQSQEVLNTVEKQTKTEPTTEKASEESKNSEQKKENKEIISYSSTRYLVDTDLAGMSENDLMLARNEIFARHGRGFKDKEIQDYFDGQEWYKRIYEPDEFDTGLLTDVEIKNIEFIKVYESIIQNDYDVTYYECTYETPDTNRRFILTAYDSYSGELTETDQDGNIISDGAFTKVAMNHYRVVMGGRTYDFYTYIGSHNKELYIVEDDHTTYSAY